MSETPDSNAKSRYERFVADVEALRPQRAKPDRDALGARIGAALLGAGIAIGVVAYLISHRTADPLTQGDAVVIAGIAVCVSVTGAAIYLRHGLSHFLRIWLARLIYENAAARGAAAVDPELASANGVATAGPAAAEPGMSKEEAS